MASRNTLAAATEVGIRICLLRVVYARNGVHSSLGRDQRRFRDDAPDEALAAIARLKKSDDPRVSVGLAPHSIRAVPYDWLQELSSADGVVHSHVAEQPKELEQCHAEYGQSPLAVMARAGLVTPDFTAVHLAWPGPGDLDLLAERGAGVCVCPTTELDLGDGFFPGAQWRGRTAVGSDSHARIDILEEARLVNGIARAHAGRRNVASARPARDVLRYATSDGASATMPRAREPLGAEMKSSMGETWVDGIKPLAKRPARITTNPATSTEAQTATRRSRDEKATPRRASTSPRRSCFSGCTNA